MALSNFYLTDAGSALLARAQAGEQLTITRAQIGEGTWPKETTYANITALVSPIKFLSIISKTTSSGQAKISVQFSNRDVGRAFKWSEFGLWAANPDYPEDRGRDILYGTAYAGTSPVPIESALTEFIFNVIVKTGTASNVTVTIDSSIVYISESDFNAKINAPGGIAGLGEDGKIQQEQLPEMNYDPAGSAAAVQKNLTTHVNNQENPHNVTAKQVGADPAGSAAAVQQALNTHTSNKQNPHGVTAAQVGAYTKAQTLQAATAALYPGLSASSNPDAAFLFLGQYTQWRWNRRTVSWNTVKGSNTSITMVTEGATVTLRYSASVTVSNEGVVSLSGYTSKSITTDNWTNTIETTLRNKYFTVKNGGQVYYFDTESSTTHYSPSGGDQYVQADKVKPVTASKSTGPWEEVRASTDDAYPNSGISGGYEYEAQGMPLEKAAALPLSTVLAMIAEQEQIRADVDYLAIMGGVEL